MQIKRPFFGGERATYHHGSLKDALIDAARQLVAERGPAGFTLAEAAKRVGVTGAAPYRHFADRQALLHELALRGFAQFGTVLREAWHFGQPDPTTAMRRMGRAYQMFAREEPGLYSAMFGSAAMPQDIGTAGLATQAFEMLVAATAAVLAQHGIVIQAQPLAYEIWAMAHGVAMLGVTGFLHAGQAGCDPEAILGSATASLIEMAVRRAKESKGEATRVDQRQA